MDYLSPGYVPEPEAGFRMDYGCGEECGTCYFYTICIKDKETISRGILRGIIRSNATGCYAELWR